MRKFVSIILIGCLVILMSACSGGEAKAETDISGAAANDSVFEDSEKQDIKAESSDSGTESMQNSLVESDISEDIDNEAWNTFESLGNIETENGILTVSITMPSDFVGEDITQESLDEGAGERYVSAKLNEDGSVTYKLTKKQHKAMMEGVVQSMDKSLQEMVDSDKYSFTKIVHNDDYTLFDVSLSGNELSFTDGLATLALYMYGGIYGIFTGKTPEKVIVNYYNLNGDLINTADSSKMKS